MPADLRHAPAQDKAGYLASQGVPHATANHIVIQDAEGREVPPDGETLGEVLLRGNTVMSGYLKDAEATAAAFKDGWFHTGDLAVRLPDGRFQIRDRAKDIIISGGENISSLEVENVLHRHPAVSLAAVVAAPDRKWGETPVAFVELRTDCSEKDLDAFCRQHLSGFKRPRHYVFGSLPKTATGKVQKYVLRDKAGSLEDEDANG